MLSVSGISKSYGGRCLFNQADLQINRGEKLGLVGPNGAGKSTLFSVILGEVEPDEGQLQKERGLRMGYLPQESMPVADESVLETALNFSRELVELRRALHIARTDPDEAHPAGDGDAFLRYQEAGGYELEPKAKRLLKGLGFDDADFERPASQMSGGWVMRAHLARLLVQEPDLLMLDEPTNHLDLEVLLWLQRYLKSYSGAILLISHDREFLNELVDGIVEISFSKLVRYRGDYDQFVEQKQARHEQHVAAYKNQQKEIDRLMVFVDRFRAKNTKATQAQSKLKQIERMEKIDAPLEDKKSISFQFPQPERSGRRVVRLTNIHQAYGDHVVYRGMDFEAERGKRIVLVGPNGAGKSTLLKILSGAVPFQSGSRELGHNVRCGYFSQYRTDQLDPERGVLDEALSASRSSTELFVRTLLGAFLFREDDVFKKVKVLSGGEKSRLALVKLLLAPPNLLLMDEPTTHLDISSIDALVEALKRFEGTLIFISHDVYFIKTIANHVVHIDSGRLRHFPGGYDYYLHKIQSESERGSVTAQLEGPTRQTAAPIATTRDQIKAQKRREAEARQARSSERREVEKRVERLEKEIHAFETEQAELTSELENTATYSVAGRAKEINFRLAELQGLLNQRTVEWEKAAHQLEEINARPLLENG